MTAILGVFAAEPEPLDERVVRAMLQPMARRGADRAAVWRDDGVALGASRYEWESAPGGAAEDLVVREGALAVAADASLYYVDDLERALAAEGIPLRGRSPGRCILAAYRAWGEACASRLEGDFAFVLWDGELRKTVCARDFSGVRTLHYAALGPTLVVASTIGGVLAHPRCSSDLNLVRIAELAAGLWGAGSETAFRSVALLGAGETLIRPEGGPPSLERHWTPPEIGSRGAPPFEEAADELRELLRRAVEERLAPQRPTSVWMSGGYDSTAVFGAGQAVLERRASDGGRLVPVSVSYPEGDSGREDELIGRVARRWGVAPHWIPIDDVPFLDEPERRAAARDSPFAHAYEMWNRALARGSRAVGSRVALSGYGGDQLFLTTDVYLADLLRRGRWASLWKRWRARADRGVRPFLRDVVLPTLPEPVVRGLQRRGRATGWRPPLDRGVPAWIDRAFARRHDLAGRDRRGLPTGGDLASRELRFYLTSPYFPRVYARVFELALEEGVEVRSPLYDGRIVAFAASRPTGERNAPGESKRLLRRAMRGLLPPEVLRPRARRTGTMSSYFDRSMRQAHPRDVASALQEPVLETLGLVDGKVARRFLEMYVERGGEELGIRLFSTYQAELWVRPRWAAESDRTDESTSDGGGVSAGTGFAATAG